MPIKIKILTMVEGEETTAETAAETVIANCDVDCYDCHTESDHR